MDPKTYLIEIKSRLVASTAVVSIEVVEESQAPAAVDVQPGRIAELPRS